MKNAVLLFFATLAALAAVLAVELRPLPLGRIAVVANPFAGTSALDLIGESGGWIVAAGPTPWIAIGIDAGDGRFRERLTARSALLILRGDGARTCRGRDPRRARP